MKRIVLVLAILIVAGSAALFAQSGESSWAKSYDKDGQFNLYGSVGLSTGGLGIGASVAGEYIITNIRIGDVYLPFGVGVRGAFNSYSFGYLGYSATWVDWGVGPFASLHLGFRNAPFEVYVSAGLSVTGYSYSNSYYGTTAFPIGFLTAEGVIWHFSDAFGLLLEYVDVGYASSFDVGLQVKF